MNFEFKQFDQGRSLERRDGSGFGRRFVSALRKLAARSVGNLRDPLRIVRDRFAVRPAFYPSIPWAAWITLCVLLTVACLVFLDGWSGSQQDRWAPTLATGANAFTGLGLSSWYLVSSVILLLCMNPVDWRAFSRRQLMMAYNWTSLAFFVLIAVGSSGLAVTVLKHIVGRARPANHADLGILSFHPLSLEATFASFPSGHATTMGAVAGVLVLLFPKARYFVLPVAIWIALTRIFVGAHYPSDTVAGFGLGFACAVLTALVFARLGFIFRQRPVGLPIRKKTFRLGRARRAPGTAAAAASKGVLANHG